MDPELALPGVGPEVGRVRSGLARLLEGEAEWNTVPVGQSHQVTRLKRLHESSNRSSVLRKDSSELGSEGWT